MEDQVRIGIIWSSIPVDQDQTVSLIVVDQAGGGVHRQTVPATISRSAFQIARMLFSMVF